MATLKVNRSAGRGGLTAELVTEDRVSDIGVDRAVLERLGFRGKPGETVAVLDGDRPRVLVGLGTDPSATEVRRAAGGLVRSLVNRDKRLAVSWVGGTPDDPAIRRALLEGLLLGAYTYDAMRSTPKEPKPRIAELVVVDEKPAAWKAHVARAEAVAEAQCRARDFVNEPGGSLTAPEFASRGAELARAAGLKVTVMDEKAIARARLGGLLAVNRGSTLPPRLLRLEYVPARAKRTVAIVGKGITFDSGGLSIKPADGMIGMKADMAGAAAVISAACALPALKGDTRVLAFAPMTDNMLGGDAQRVGDVFTARNGTTVEVLNTDAEGRLVLADALTLAGEAKPDAIVDLATLTGACMVALGDRIAGLMANDDGFREEVHGASERAGEEMWPLPLPDRYRKLLDSPIADMKNIAGRYGGALTAGLFLREFVPAGIPWAHLDIAGPAFSDQPDGEQPAGGTGFGVRTLLELLAPTA